jgi:hypothetical protein
MRDAWRWLLWIVTLALLPGVAMGQDIQQDVLPPFAPPSPLRFERFSLEDGLSQNSVLAMLQDRQGYLWFGTQDGLNRFDGYTFTAFKHDPDNTNSLSLNSILTLYEDDDGALWIGTWGGGLNRFDPHSNVWTRFRRDAADPASLCGDVVTALLADRDGALWIGTNDGGLCVLDRTTMSFTAYRHAADERRQHSQQRRRHVGAGSTMARCGLAPAALAPLAPVWIASTRRRASSPTSAPIRTIRPPSTATRLPPSSRRWMASCGWAPAASACPAPASPCSTRDGPGCALSAQQRTPTAWRTTPWWSSMRSRGHRLGWHMGRRR